MYVLGITKQRSNFQIFIVFSYEELIKFKRKKCIINVFQRLGRLQAKVGSLFL